IGAVTGPGGVVAEAVVVDARLADHRGADGIGGADPGGGLRIGGDSLRGVIEQVHDVQIRRERSARVEAPVVKHLKAAGELLVGAQTVVGPVDRLLPGELEVAGGAGGGGSAIQIRNFPNLLAQEFCGDRVPLRLGNNVAGEGSARPDAVVHRSGARVVNGVDSGSAAIGKVAVQLVRCGYVPGDLLALALHQVLARE